MGARPAGRPRRHARPDAAGQRRPHLPVRRHRRRALARHPHAGRPGDAAPRGAPGGRRGRRHRLGPGRRLGARPAARPARRRRRPQRLRADAPGAARRLAVPTGLAGAGVRAGAGGAGARSARAEGHRPRGVARLARAGPEARRPGTRSGRPGPRWSAGRTGRPDLGAHPVLGLAPRRRRPVQVAHLGHRRRSCRPAGGAGRATARSGRDRPAQPARHRSVDRRRGRAARLR